MKFKRLVASVVACAMMLGAGVVFPAFVETETLSLTVGARGEKTYKDWTYIKYGKYVEITQYNGNAKTVEIPAEIEGLPVTHIGVNTFYNHTNLTSVIIPNSVTVIGQQAFCGCESLDSVIIPDGVTTIENSAFMDCYELTSIIIPNKVVHIGDLAFWGCIRLMSVTISDSVTEIGTGAFYDCVSLEDIYYTGTEEQWNVIAFLKNTEYISVYDDSSVLENATIHFNYVEPAEISVSSLVDLNKTFKAKKGAPKKYDLNGDGVVNVIDLALLKHKLLNK